MIGVREMLDDAGIALETVRAAAARVGARARAEGESFLFLFPFFLLFFSLLVHDRG